MKKLFVVSFVLVAACAGDPKTEPSMEDDVAVANTDDVGANEGDASMDEPDGRDDSWSVDDYFMQSEVGEIPEYEQREGNVDLGYDILVNEGYVSCGIPGRIYDMLLAGDVPQWAQLAGRRNGNEDLPYNMTRFDRDGIELVSQNCLVCHANTLPDGQLKVGLGNEGDFTTDLGRYIEAGRALVDEEDEREVFEYDRFLERTMTVQPHIKMHTVGVNPAEDLAAVLTAHRDPETWAWLTEPWYEYTMTAPIPLSVPPWWNAKKKNALYYTSIGRGDHARFMMAAALLCTDSIDEAREIDEMFVHVQAYIESIKPPEYPYAIDRDLAETGEVVFEETCSRCHGTYGTEWTYPNLVIALDEVGTDPLLAEQGPLAGRESVAWMNRSFFGEVSLVAPALGYVAPPLDGVWATAPYLHNASVPTIRAMLDSSLRPDGWRRTSGPYDQENLGISFEVVEGGKAAAGDDAGEALQIYDTSLAGYSNQGHTFGDELSAEERDALLEYLKTL